METRFRLNYWYIILRTRIVAVKGKVIPLAKIMGKSLRKIPYTSHKKIPIVSMEEYITKDKLLVFFVFIVLIAWGRNETVVHIAAAKPSKVIQFI